MRRSRGRLSLALVLVAGLAITFVAPPGTVVAQSSCDPYSGGAWGLCTAYCEALECDRNDPDIACDKVAAKFFQVAGTAPPCAVKLYVSRDVAQCAAILFLCGEGFQPFYDATGCGCERIP